LFLKKNLDIGQVFVANTRSLINNENKEMQRHDGQTKKRSC
jgi:hypothetical protein